MESETAKLRASDVTSPEPPKDAFGQIFLASYRLGDINVFHGVPFLSQEGQRWIGFRHEDNSLERPPGLLWQNLHQRQSELLSHPEMRDLPERSIVEACLQDYKESEFSSHLPVVDPVLFEATIEEAYNSADTDSHRISAIKACVFAFMAMGTLFADSKRSMGPDFDANMYHAAVRFLQSDVLIARASTEVLDGLMILVSHRILLFIPGTWVYDVQLPLSDVDPLSNIFADYI